MSAAAHADHLLSTQLVPGTGLGEEVRALSELTATGTWLFSQEPTFVD